MITINYLHHNRSMFKMLFFYLNKIKNRNFRLNILTEVNNGDFWKFILKDANFDCDIVLFNKGLNYLGKINYAAENSDEIAVKLDEDIFIHNNTWDHIFDNLNLLDDPKCLCLIPTVSNGIPGCDHFLKDFLSDDQQRELYRIFLNTTIPSNGGPVGGGYNGNAYEILNQHTINTKEWLSIDWWNTVSKIEYHYKGIHPMRINDEAQLKLLDFININYQKFCNQTNREMFLEKPPYICNGMFVIKTKLWNRILKDHTLYVDAFDEVPLNKYKDKNDMYISRSSGYGIHPCFGSLKNSKEVENRFYLEFLHKVTKYENSRS